MRRKALGLIGLIVLGIALGGCAKCGGWDKFNLPWNTATACDDTKLK